MRLPTLEEVRQARAYASFSYFMDYDSDGRDREGSHLDVLDAALQQVSSGELTRLIVTMPPRHGKSERVSKKFPAWHLGRNPEDEMIVASYSIDLARDFSRIAKDTLGSRANVFDQTVDKNRAAAESWGIAGHRGGLVAAGVGGPITGRGAKIAIIDDPVKNSEEANSQTMRDKIWEWYQSTLYTRLTPDGRIIVVMTRWHEDDLVGRLLRKEQEEIETGEHVGERWTVINFPAIAEDNDVLGRAPGEPLWPEYGFDIKRLEKIKQDVGSYVFNALYQQRPSAQEGNMFKRHWWRFWQRSGQNLPPVPVRIGEQILHIQPETLPGRFDEQIQSWDCTFKDSDGSDLVCGQVWGREAVNKYLLDQVKDRMDIIRTMDEILSMTTRWPKARLKLIEDKANGPAVMQMLKRKVSGMVAVQPEGGKIARASAAAPEVEAGNVFLPHPMIAPWVQEFINVFASFPKVAHDDEVDAFSQAMGRLMYHTSARQDYHDDHDYSGGSRTGY